ncbi:MAG: ATP-binding protein [Dysgonomonas sp.]
MKIQIRQSIYMSIAFGVVFIIVSFLVYVLYADKAKKAVYKNLEKTANLVALFHLEEDELNSKEFEKIKKQFAEIVSETSYQLYDESDSIVFGNRNENINSEILQKIHQEKCLNFSTTTNFCYGIFYEDNQGDFIIITKEPQAFLYEQLASLLWILVSALIIGLIIVILLSRWLSQIAYKPISNIMKQVNSFSFDNPDEKIELPNTKDELEELTETFNNLLGRISETFVIQKNFVSYVSHEFRTPLTSMQGNLEVFSLKDRNPKEYEELSRKLILQIMQLEKILNTLIVVSDLRKNVDLNNQFRIDELIWEIIEKISVHSANPKIDVIINILPEDEKELTITKDRTQLLMALFNIIENAIKYSEKVVDIRIYKESGCLYLSIEDQGIGIPDEKLANISRPFFRGDNTNRINGSGIGLSIALRILEKNDIRYTIESQINIGTKVIICFE